MDHERGALIQQALAQYAALAGCSIVPALDDPRKLRDLLDALSARELRIVVAALDLLVTAASRG